MLNTQDITIEEHNSFGKVIEKLRLDNISQSEVYGSKLCRIFTFFEVKSFNFLLYSLWIILIPQP